MSRTLRVPNLSEMDGDFGDDDPADLFSQQPSLIEPDDEDEPEDE